MLSNFRLRLVIFGGFFLSLSSAYVLYSGVPKNAQTKLSTRPVIFPPASLTITKSRYDFDRIKTMTPVRMAEEDENTNGEKENKSPSDKKAGSGFFTGLLVAPPLIAKFIVVLIVKFLNDLVVFPLLFIYRMARLCKNKALKLIGKDIDKKNNA